MSEILIKGMEMPKSCGECRASGTDVCRKWMGKKNLKVRSEDCPLVELPEHGRLGDLDKMESAIIEEFSVWPEHCGADFAEFIKNAPTILEATE